MFGKSLSMTEVADLCRTLGSSLHAGLPVPKSLQMAAKGGRPRMAGVCNRMLEKIKDGDDLAGAFKSQSEVLPPLLIAMMSVATKTGNVPEVLRELEKFYRFMIRLRRQFYAQITWPILQLLAAIFIIAFVIYIIGAIAPKGNSDVLGIGLSGSSGALTWIFCWFGFFGILGGLYYYLRQVLKRSDQVDGLLLRIPVLGGCLRTLALARSTFAMHMTLDSGLSVYKAIPLFLEASENGAFIATGPAIAKALKKGSTLDDAFREHPIYPDVFLEVVHTGVETGSVPEAMKKLSEQYREKSELELQVLNTAAGWVVWFIVAAIIIFFIFRIVMTAYIGPMNEALKGF